MHENLVSPMSGKQGSLTAKLVTYKTAGYGLAVVALGVLFLLWSNNPWPDDTKVWQTTVAQLGGLFVTTGGLGVLWDLRGKRDIMDEVLEKTRLSSDIGAAGLDRVTMNWLDVPWEDLFARANQIEVFISYGSSWRKIHWSKIQTFAKDSKHSLRLYLPDPEDDATMRILGQRYSYTPEKIIEHVRETAYEFAKLGSMSPADIRIYYRAGDPCYTSYRFDDQVLVTLYSHKRERGEVPTMLIKKGSFGKFFAEDLGYIHDQSRPIPLDDFLVGEEQK